MRNSTKSHFPVSVLAKCELIGSKKNLPFSAQVKRTFVEADNKKISMVRQCQLLGINRSTIYYAPRAESDEDVELDAIT